jgi:hypothetical protein
MGSPSEPGRADDTLLDLELGLANASVNGDLARAQAIEREATLLASHLDGQRRQRAAEIATKARQTASRIGMESAGHEAVEKDISPVSLGLVGVGALIMLIAVFLPRVESNTFLRVAQNTLIQSGDGWWFLGIAVGLAGSAWLAYTRRNAGPGPFILGLIAIGLAVYYGTNKGQLRLCPVNNAATSLGLTCSQASPSTGIYAAGVGGLLAAIGGWQMWRAPGVVEPARSVEPEAKVIPPNRETLAERMRTLDRLRTEGLLNEDEYAEQRHRLLNEI